jgi:hypothetical protein
VWRSQSPARSQNIHLQECQTDTDGHRIKAGGNRGGDQQPETVTAGASVCSSVHRETFQHHSPPRNISNEGNPVIPLQHKLAGKHPQTPANKRRQRFNCAKNQAGTECFENLGLCRVAPLPIDAAKASIDMPKARRMVADKFMRAS